MRKALILIVLGVLIASPAAVLAYDTDYRYTGKPYDPAADLYDYGARNYQPDIGRFIQPDPVQFNLTNPEKLKEMTGQDLDKFLQNPQNFNSYSYVQNNPVKYTDPTGEFAFTVAGTAIGGIVGMAYSYRSVASYFKNVFRGNIYAAGDDAQTFLDTTKNGVIIGASIGMAIDTVWGAIGLAKMSSPTWQINNANGTINFRYTQIDIKKNFSSEPGVPKFFQNRSIDEVANEIKANNSLASQVSIGYIDRDGYRLIDNTRSAVVLQKAGIVSYTPKFGQ